MDDVTMRRITITKAGPNWSLSSTLNPEYQPNEIVQIGGWSESGQRFILREALSILLEWISADKVGGWINPLPEPEVHLVGGNPEDWVGLSNIGEDMAVSFDDYSPECLSEASALLFTEIHAKEKSLRDRREREKKGEDFASNYIVPVKLRDEDISPEMRFALLAALVGSASSDSFAEELLEVHESAAIQVAAAITKSRPEYVARAIAGEKA